MARCLRHNDRVMRPAGRGTSVVSHRPVRILSIGIVRARDDSCNNADCKADVSLKPSGRTRFQGYRRPAAALIFGVWPRSLTAASKTPITVPLLSSQRAKTEPASARKRHIRSSPATGSRGATVSTMARRCRCRSSTTARRCCQSTNVDARAIVASWVRTAFATAAGISAPASSSLRRRWVAALPLLMSINSSASRRAPSVSGGDPPALPGRHPEFDNSGSGMRNSRS